MNTLRLWSARAADPISLDDFNRGDHVGALADRVRLEAISRVLYPNDDTPAGLDLRLRQEYFFASASLQDLISRHKQQHGELSSLGDHAAIQLNDTHPAIAVPELMRLLVDLHGMPWDLAWSITTSVFNYTNHTLLPEALETWAVPLLESLLPRHMQIIREINTRHLDAGRAQGRADADFLASVSLVEENHGQRVKMGHLAFVGSRRVNGVSALHTDLMRRTVFRDLHALHPERIVNKTNGITFRRWLHQANPGLTRLIVDAIGPRVLDDENALEALAPMARGRRVARALRGRAAREQGGAGAPGRRARRREPRSGRAVRRPHQAHPRIQAAAAEHPRDDRAVRGHAGGSRRRAGCRASRSSRARRRPATGRRSSSSSSSTTSRGPSTRTRRSRGLLKVVFLPNYNVSLAEVIIPAADLSEQISTAGMEASGTGNMKLALNGALTIGTLDGANIEIRERVGADNFFLFGLTAEEVDARRRDGPGPARNAGVVAGAGRRAGCHRCRRLLAGRPGALPRTRRTTCANMTTSWSRPISTATGRHRRPSTNGGAILRHWWASAIANTARVGWFSSDRAIREYADEIWRVTPKPP